MIEYFMINLLLIDFIACEYRYSQQTLHPKILNWVSLVPFLSSKKMTNCVLEFFSILLHHSMSEFFSVHVYLSFFFFISFYTKNRQRLIPLTTLTDIFFSEKKKNLPTWFTCWNFFFFAGKFSGVFIRIRQKKIKNKKNCSMSRSKGDEWRY